MRTILRTVVVAFVFCIASGAAHAQGRPSLFEPGAAQDGKRLEQAQSGQRRELLRARDVSPDLALLARIADGLQRNPGVPQVLDIPVFDNLSFAATLTRVERPGNGVTNLYGTLDGVPYGTVVLTLARGTLAGTLHANGKAYQIQFLGKGRYEVQEIDPQQFDGHHDHTTPGPRARPKAGMVAPQFDDGSVVDVLVVYTPEARAEASPGDPSNPAAILAAIDNAIAATNLAYTNSGVTQRLNLAHAQEVTYTESGNFTTELLRLSDVNAPGMAVGPDGFLDEVQTIRDT